MALLAGLRVLDLTHHIAGPFCTKLLGGLGAEVIKIEKPGEGDPARRAGPFPQDRPDPEASGLFLYLNTSKKSLTLNLKTTTGRSLVKRLIGEADILVENFSPRVLPKLGLDYAVLHHINPSLVVAHISNFGQTGPYRDYKATSLIEQALGGFMNLNGDPDRPPLKQGGSQAEYQAGLVAVVAVLTALYYRDETGHGQEIDVSIMECVTSILDYAPVMYAYQKRVRKRIGDRHLFAGHPTGFLKCKDGYIATAVQMQPQWESLCRMIERPELLEDPRFTTHLDRVAHADDIDTILQPWLMERTCQEVFETAQLWRIPFGLVCTTEDLLKDPQYKERGFFLELDHPKAGTLTYPGAPFKLSTGEWPITRAPLLGEHNEEIYGGRLGYSRSDLGRLRQTGVI